jgi:UDP-N-acetylglucosamine 2-epimerase (non-hydrolysing)
MKVVTIAGTRPELIRLSRIIPLLDKYCGSDHIFVHTGQNYDKNLKDIFFEELGIRDPNYSNSWKVGSSLANDISNVLQLCETVIKDEKPDKLLILGDTNSALSAIIAKRYGVKVYHMESGNRCYDDKVPEEVNRRIIDSCSDILMPYTERSRQNLIREGYPSNKIFVTGNPINEVLHHYIEKIDASTIMSRLNISPKSYFLVTMHRSENVDNVEILHSLIKSLSMIATWYRDYKIIISMHPHTVNRITDKDLVEFLSDPRIIFHEPFGFFDFVKLERNAACVISDSGTVQEECCIFGIPSVTIRSTTERPETIECGSNILVGHSPNDILRGIDIATKDLSIHESPLEYQKRDVSNVVMKILFGV